MDYQNHVELHHISPDLFVPCVSILCGIVACKLVYDFSRSVSPVLFKSYSGLQRMQQVEWNNRVVSSLHAVFVAGLSLYLAFWPDLYVDDDLQQGPVMFRYSWLSTSVLGISVGYFLSDLSMILWFYPSLGGMEFVLHHFLSLSALSYAMLNGMGQFYTLMVLISETTTPAINLRWYLDVSGLKRSRAYVVNGSMIFLTWLVTRILLFIYVFYHMFMHYNQIKLLPSLGYLLIIVAPTIISALNLMWFGKITRGLLKTLAKHRHGE